MPIDTTNHPTEKGFLIGALTTIVSEEVRRRVYEEYREAGLEDLTFAHSSVFMHLSRDGDRIVDLAKRVGVSKQAMGYLVGYLEERGYLERLPHPSDGRAQLVRRTDRGWEVNQIARRLVLEIQKEWAAQLGQAKMEQLVILLRELVSLIGVDYHGSVSDVDQL